MVNEPLTTEPGVPGENADLARRVRWSLAKSPLRRPLVWFRHRGIQANDAFIAGYPRSGTTWTRFMLYEVACGQASTFDRVNAAVAEVGDQSSALRPLPRNGRLLKTHELYRRSYKRAVYLVRDIRDVVISEYNYLIMKRYIPEQPFDDFLDQFLEKKVNTFGSWLSHVKSWLDARDNGETAVLIVRYEDLLNDTQHRLRQVCEFLGLSTEENVIRRAIVNNTKQEMSKKEDQARDGIFRKFRNDIRFVRRASSGYWSDVLSEEQLEKIEYHAHEILARLDYPLLEDIRTA